MLLPRVVNKSGLAFLPGCAAAIKTVGQKLGGNQTSGLIAVQRWNGFINPPFYRWMPP